MQLSSISSESSSPVGSVSALELSRQLLTTLLIVVLVALGAGIVPFLGVSIPVGLVVVFSLVAVGPRLVSDFQTTRTVIAAPFP